MHYFDLKHKLLTGLEAAEEILEEGTEMAIILLICGLYAFAIQN